MTECWTWRLCREVDTSRQTNTGRRHRSRRWTGRTWRLTTELTVGLGSCRKNMPLNQARSETEPQNMLQSAHHPCYCTNWYINADNIYW